MKTKNPIDESLEMQGKRKGVKITVLLLSLTLIGGCTSQKRFESAEKMDSLPKQWQAPAEFSTALLPENWLTDFADPRLEKLIEKALVQNYDLRLTALQLEKIHASSRIQTAPLWPTVGADFTGRRGETKLAEHGSTSVLDTKKVGVGLSVSWEVDVWGRLRARASANRHEVEAATADYRAARISLIGQVAKLWYRIISENMQLQLLERTLESYRLATRLIRERYQSGIAGPLDLRLALANLASTEDLFYSRVNKRDLQRLLNEYPDGRLNVATKLPHLPKHIRAGVPADILQNRPDIAAAKNRLQAAQLGVAVAQRDFLPTFSLTGELGTSSAALRSILDLNHSFWNVFGGLTQPIFRGGRLQANLDLANISATQAKTSYGQILHRALSEVEQSLSAGQYLIDRSRAVHTSENEARAAESLAMAEYGAGLVDVVTLLEAQRRLLNAQSDLIAVHYLQLANRIDLYIALGGAVEKELVL